jgi:hypothetical protein
MLTGSDEIDCNNYSIKIELPYVIFEVNNRPPSKIKLGRKDIEDLKEYCQKWLCENPLPRYYVKKCPVNDSCWKWKVQDRELENITLAVFGVKAQAEKYCDFLNDLTKESD